MRSRLPLLLAGVLLAACGSTASNKPHPGSGAAGNGNNGGADAGGASKGGGNADGCQSPPPPATLVRLTFSELGHSLANLLGTEATTPIAQELELPDDDEAFPPLDSEGHEVTDAVFRRGDLLAQRASTYVLEHFAGVTGCAKDYACVHDFVDAFAEQAFRHPLDEDEQAAIDRVLDGAQALGAPPEGVAQYGVYAVLVSPHFLYRSELGPPAAAGTQGEVRLSDHELASSLSFFLTGAPPDAPLLKAAAAHDLGGPEQLAPHVERLLATPAAKTHLQVALRNYFGITRLRNVILDSTAYPTFNGALRSAMDFELQKLFESTLWSGPVSALLTSRTARVDQSLAALYGVAFPPAGTEVDQRGFAQVELPHQRAGLFTRAGWLTAGSRPDGPSVVGRGLSVYALLCEELPPPPEQIPNQATTPTNQHPTERERSEFRQQTETCKDCHLEFDAYGLALDEFDAIGRYRRVDPEGRAIDPTVTLPTAAGGVQVTGGAELSTAVAGQIFTKCLTQRFLQYAESSFAGDRVKCEAQTIADAGQLPGDVSFVELLKNVALSRAFAYRQR